METEKYITIAFDRAKQSFNNGEFPAGAVVVSIDGDVFMSNDSYGWNHAESQVVDMAVSKFGPDLSTCILYTTMIPCIGCLSKIYWGGIRTVRYVLNQDEVTSELCFDGTNSVLEHVKHLHSPITLEQIDFKHTEIINVYRSWEKQIGYDPKAKQ